MVLFIFCAVLKRTATCFGCFRAIVVDVDDGEDDFGIVSLIVFMLIECICVMGVENVFDFGMDDEDVS